MSKSLFELGRIIMTGRISVCYTEDNNFHNEINNALFRYKKADWSDMEYEEDKLMNEQALKSGDDRIFATYNTSRGKIYIITECDRSVTTILFPDEY